MTSIGSRLWKRYERDGFVATFSACVRYLKAKMRQRTRQVYYRVKFRLGSDRVRLNGIVLNLDTPVATRSIRRSIWRGDYEYDEARFVSTYLSPDTDVIELGAGMGFVSATVDDVLDDGRTQIAVEPNPDVIPVLRRTKDLNDCSFSIEQLAYSTTDSVELRPDQAFWSKGTDDVKGEGATVPGVSLSTLLESHDVSEFALVADIEGGEFELFESELDLLTNRCDLLVVEFHPDEDHEIETYHQMLEVAGFERLGSRHEVSVYRNDIL